MVDDPGAHPAHRTPLGETGTTDASLDQQTSALVAAIAQAHADHDEEALHTLRRRLLTLRYAAARAQRETHGTGDKRPDT